MSEEKRPGGLTALAVLNFVFTAIYVFSILSMITLFGLQLVKPFHEIDAPHYEAIRNVGKPILITIFSIVVISTIILPISGVGFLKQKRFLGRTLGNAYAILVIVNVVLTGVMFDPKIGGGFSIGTITGIIYPMLLLILLNTTFKEDFIN